jgi:hypothetical protein
MRLSPSQITTLLKHLTGKGGKAKVGPPKKAAAASPVGRPVTPEVDPEIDRLLNRKGKLKPHEVDALLEHLGVKGGGSGLQRAAAAGMGHPFIASKVSHKAEPTWMEATGNQIRKQTILHPVASTAAAGATGAFLATQGAHLTGSLADTFDMRGRHSGALMAERELALHTSAERMKAERLMGDMRRNSAIIMQEFPHLAAQLTAGRRLPRGAVVLGGTPRADLLQEAAMGMSTGELGGSQMGAEDLFLRGR